MSLLMDALKKAEQEKKEAAKRLQEAQEKTDGRIQLQEKETRAAEIKESKSKDEVEVKTDTPTPVTEKKTTPDLSLSPLDSTIAGPEEHQESEPVSEPDTEPEQDSEEIELSSDSSSPSLSLQKDVTIDHPEMSEPDADAEEESTDHVLSVRKLDETFALEGLAIEDATSGSFEDTANATLQEKNAETISGSRISKSIISAADLVKDMGGGREAPTPVAAQTVFKASIRSSGKQQIFEWSMFIGLLTIIMIAAGSFYYLKITPLTPKTSSPLVAKGIEADLKPEINIPVPENIGQAELSGEVEIGEAIREATGTVEDSMPVVAEPEKTGDSDKVTASEEIEDTPEITAVTGDAEISPAGTALSPEAVTSDQRYDTVQLLPEKIEVEDNVIAISRSKSVDKKDQLINVAYSYYVNGDYSGAETVYRDVLKQDPENRDALLGTAAIAYRKGNIQYAYEQYLKILKLNPKDIVAKTALISLQENANAAESESIIKLMIKEQPESAYLYFSLGNIYAGQKRWADAQLAFFEAYRLQPDNSDYAYNLAVSLDHLGQVKSASDYYTIAIDLADESQPGFNTSSVISRLNTLSLNTHPE